jgi:hypothetical protein
LKLHEDLGPDGAGAAGNKNAHEATPLVVSGFRPLRRA